MIQAYRDNKEIEIIPTPPEYETMKLDKGKAKEDPKVTEMEREWEESHGLVNEFNLNDGGNLEEDTDFL